MSAVVLAFPRLPASRLSVPTAVLPAPFTAQWCSHHLPLIDAAMDLLAADEAEFERRCKLMRDEDGRAMLDELAEQLQRLGTHIADVADALGLTAERIKEAVTKRVLGRPLEQELC